jgi:hypothetical protein
LVSTWFQETVSNVMEAKIAVHAIMLT